MHNKLKRSDIIAILSRPMLYQYFFRTLDKPGWFDYLLSIGVLTEIPNPETNSDKSISFPVWWPGVYLVKVADKIPDKVSSLIISLKTDNLNAINAAMDAILKIPLEYAMKLLPTIDRWLDAKYQTLVNYQSIDLLGKFIEAKEYDSAFELLDILSKPNKNKPADKTYYVPKLRYEDHSFREKVVKKYLSELIQHSPGNIIEIYKKYLEEALELVVGNGKYDGAYWREAVEESEKYYSDDVRELFTDILRDTMEYLAGKDKPKAEKFIREFLQQKHVIFRRIALHAARIGNISNVIQDVILNKDYLHDPLVYHEYYRLVQDNFIKIPLDKQKQFIGWILEGPKKKDNEDEGRKDYWIKRRLSMVKDHITEGSPLAEYLPKIKEYELEKVKIEHPEKLMWASDVHTGPTSPLTKDAMTQKSVDEFVEFIKFFNPKRDFAQPTPEGLGRLFEEVVKDNPEKYAVNADKFLEQGIYPTYIVHLIRGFELAWKANKTFNWAPVLFLCEKVMIMKDEDAVKGRDDYDYGRFAWANGSISNLLCEAVRRDEHIIPDEFLPNVKEILFYILSNDPDPTTEDEAKYGGDNMDFVTYAINCNRGKAQEALILYVLKYARIHAKKEEVGNPFPPGERLEDDVKKFLSDRMEKEISPSVHSVFGRFLPHLYYLDQKWVETKIKEGALFSLSNEQFWQADWQGYMFVGSFYDRLFRLLSELGHYKKAILASRDKTRQEGNGLADHLMSAFWRSLIELDSKDGLLKLFFEVAPLDARQRAIYSLGTALDKANDIPEFKKIWPRLRALWESRLKEAKDDEAVAFVTTWLKSAPENIEELSVLIKESIRHKKDPYREHYILEYILNNVERFPKVSMEILIEMLKKYKLHANVYISDRDIRPIIEKARMSNKCNDLVNEAVNILGEMGYYNFRDLLAK